MKKTGLTLILLAFTLAIYAQNPRTAARGDRRTETYTTKKGLDSVRFTILGKNDTLQTDYFYRNGKVNLTKWKNDSMAFFDVFGRITRKSTQLPNAALGNGDFTAFYSNGQPFSSQTLENGVTIRKQYAEDGRVLSKTTETRLPLRSYFKSEDAKGKLIRHSRTDTTFVNGQATTHQYDTAFYADGRPLFLYERSNDIEFLGSQTFNQDGTIADIALPDSVTLILFKDNVDCYYGLKNRRGDTVVKPRFDRIELLNKAFWVAYTGESAMLLSLSGAPMTPPVGNLSNVRLLQNHYQEHDFEAERSGDTDRERAVNLYFIKPNYAFNSGDKHGVMDAKGRLVMAPQYLDFGYEQMNNGQFFPFHVMEGDVTVKSSYMTRLGQPLFGDRFKNVEYCDYKDYFFLGSNANRQTHRFGRFEGWVNKAFKTRDFYLTYDIKNTFGLGKADNEVLFDTKFCAIERLRSTDLFVASILDAEKSVKAYSFRDGVYNAATKRWLLDTLDFRIHNDIKHDRFLFVVERISTHKFGVMDTSGKFIVPFAYDSIYLVDVDKRLFWIKKDNQYQILDIKTGKANLHKPKYTALSAISYEVEGAVPSERVNYFLVKQKEKWGVVDAADKVLKPFVYDYASGQTDNMNPFILVKDNQASAFYATSMPNELDYFPHSVGMNGTMTPIGNYALADDVAGVFFINDTGKVVIPPQYKPLDSDFSKEYLLVEDAEKKKKLIFLATGKVVDFPFDYKIHFADAKSPVVIVSDSTKNSFGVVSTDGKLLVPCVNYNILMGDLETSVFFVKRDTPVVNINKIRDLTNMEQLELSLLAMMKGDTLTDADSNWLMYDAKGALISNKPFRFPIEFVNGIGMGMKDEDFNLYKTDGSVFKPMRSQMANDNKKAANDKQKNDVDPLRSPNTEGYPNSYRNIRRDRETGFYSLFYNQGLQPMLILTNNKGEVLVESGRYDGVSKFYGQYAVVSAKGKIGLIDSLGRAIIAPQDLRTFKQHFMDSLDIPNKEARKEALFEYQPYFVSPLPQPIVFNIGNNKYHPDSLGVEPAQSAAVWNLLLEKTLPWLVHTASDVFITRASLGLTIPYGNNYYGYRQGDVLKPSRIVVGNKSMAFSWLNRDYWADQAAVFYNFYRKNDRWESLDINDLLQIQGEKRWLVNDLITRKVKALKDVEIDCSNAAAFITKAENQWMLTNDGIDFCFDNQAGEGDFAIVSLTWAELSPFLKMRL